MLGHSSIDGHAYLKGSVDRYERWEGSNSSSIPSSVKSIDLDVWQPEQMDSITRWGNRRANTFWEYHLKKGHVPPDQCVHRRQMSSLGLLT